MAKHQRPPRSLTSRGSVRFETRRDFEAVQTPVKRSDLGYKDPGVVALEPIVNESEDPIECEHHWKDDAFDHHSCDELADVRVVRNRDVEYGEEFEPSGPANIYSDAFCLDCLERAMNAWVDDRLERVAEAVGEKRDDESDEGGARR